MQCERAWYSIVYVLFIQQLKDDNHDSERIFESEEC